MGHFDPGPAKKEYTPPVLAGMLRQLMTAINYIDKNNFKRRISGDDILTEDSISQNKLKKRIEIYTLVSESPPYTTTNLVGSPANCGMYFPWNPDDFTGTGFWYFEADIAIADAASTVTARLMGNTEVITVTSQSTSMQRVRSAALTMPVNAMNLWVQFYTSNAGHAASIGGGKLIWIPA